ncbi:MAG: hypothetical protein ACRCZK_04795 [Oscillospiraceae bacterium]
MKQKKISIWTKLKKYLLKKVSDKYSDNLIAMSFAIFWSIVLAIVVFTHKK